MDNGFRTFALVTLVAVAVFAAVSLWPWIAESVFPDAAPATAVSAAVPPASVTPIAAQHMSGPSPVVQEPEYTFLQEEEKVPPKRWMYANGNIVLRKEPKGDPFIPLTASFAPLTVHNGTRLWPLRTDDDWVLVQSPGRTLGWVHKDEVSTDEYGRNGSYYNSAMAPRRPWL